jgi:Tol biopolymer transport system component
MNTVRLLLTTRGCGLALGFAAAVGLSTSSGAADRVSYTSSRPTGWDIYLFERTGATPRRLTTDPGLDYDAVVSPDGRWMVFTSERRGGPDLYALDLESEGQPLLLLDSDALEDQAAFSPDGESIAFVGSAAGNAEIYLVPFRPRRTSSMDDARNVTSNTGGDFRPAFSPDGSKLAFSSDRDLPVEALNPITRFRSGDIYVLDLAAAALPQRLTDSPGWDGSPAWSADGRSIAFYSERNSANRLPGINGDQPASIWIMNADGSQQRALTSVETTALSPAFLPDGRIMFARRPAITVTGAPRGAASAAALANMYEDGAWEIVSVAADGSDERIESGSSEQNFWEPARGPLPGSFVAHGAAPHAAGNSSLTDGSFGGRGSVLAENAPVRRVLPDRDIDLYPLRYSSAVLKPNEDLVLYALTPPGAQLSISTIDGRNQRVLQRDGEPIALTVDIAGFRWSRDSEWIAFTQIAGGGAPGARSPGAAFEIWKMRADGSDARSLTPGSTGYSGYPSFSGDGKRIVFRRGTNPIANIDLYLMNNDGSNVRQLTNDPANDLFPSFSPTTEQIAFLSNRANPQSSAYDVYLMELNADQTPGSVRAVTRNDVQEGHLAFSYDGRWLVFASEMGGLNDEEPLVRSVQFAPQSYGEMYAYRIEDETLVRLTHNKWEEGVPSWEAAVDAL